MATMTAYDASGRGLSLSGDSLDVTTTSEDVVTLENYYYLGNSKYMYIYSSSSEDADAFSAQTYLYNGTEYLTRLIYSNDGSTILKIEDMFNPITDLLDGLDVILSGNDVIYGNKYSDIILGFTGNDNLYGNAGNDKLYGNAGNDKLYGSAGNDRLDGSTGADQFYGGTGRDLLYAGKDNNVDVFVFNKTNESGSGAKKRDVIFQFDSGEDIIDFRRIDSDTTTAGNQAFEDFLGKKGGKFGAENSLWYVDTGKHLVVRGDVTGDGKFDFEVQVNNLNSLVENDFIL